MTTPANPDDLLAFVRAQLDDDEATTRELLYWAQQTILTLQDPKLLGKHIPGWHDWPKVERMCRVRLAEVDANRRILDAGNPRSEHEHPGEYVYFGDWSSCTDGCPGTVWHETVKLLALPYAGRDGYRDEWRPA